MGLTVSLSANVINYPQSGGHLWVYLNWALGLRALGCRVIWLEEVSARDTPEQVQAKASYLDSYLRRYGLDDSLALCSDAGGALVPLPVGCLDLNAAAEADLLVNFQYGMRPEGVERFRRSALLDIDPGLLQIWMSRQQLTVARHDLYFTIGETVGQPAAHFPDAGREWHYTPPCVELDWWPPCPSLPAAPFTTVSHWSEDGWVQDAAGEYYQNDKRSGFLPFLELPQHTTQALELALCLGNNEHEDLQALQKNGWRIRHTDTVTTTPWDYQQYIQNSRGEFSCVKPSCIRLANAWVSDRSLCYLASGKPVIVQHTGPSRFLPDAAGLFRFRDLEEAARCLQTVATDYERQCRLARVLAEEFFDARRVVGRVLARCLT